MRFANDVPITAARPIAIQRPVEGLVMLSLITASFCM